VIVLDPGEGAGTTELEEAHARLLAVLEAAGDGSSWLAGALRSALHLLGPGPGDGWTGRQPGAPGNPG
jgi:hypothetical protein